MSKSPQVQEFLDSFTRFDENFSREATKIKFVTEGILIRELMGDPLLNNYSVLILDEVQIKEAEFSCTIHAIDLLRYIIVTKQLCNR